MTTTRNHDHIKHRELYYHATSVTDNGQEFTTRIRVSKGWEVLAANERGVVIIEQYNNELHRLIPWYQVIQFTYWPDDDIGKDVPSRV